MPYTCFASDSGSASPARFTTRTDGGTAPSRTSCAIADGTVLMSVTSASGLSSASWSALRTTTTVPPRASGVNSSNTDRSKLSDVDASTAHVSSALNVSRAHVRKATALRWEIATPFGRPVLPDV
ncbi:hypothetical protein COSO111634_33430 [Corallococcus soli]